MFIRRIFCQFGNCLDQFTLWISQEIYYLLSRHGKSLNFSQYVAHIKLRSHRLSGAFLLVKNSLHSALLFTFFFSWYFKIVWPQVCFRFWQHVKVSQKCRRKCYRSVKERNCHKSQIVVCEGLGNFIKLSTEKIPRLFSFILIKVFKIYVSLS